MKDPIIDLLKALIADLLNELEQARTERDFYKAAAGKLMQGSRRHGRRAQ